MAIEPSVHIDAGLTRRSLQIVVRGSARTDSESKIRWKLSPAGASEPSGWSVVSNGVSSHTSRITPIGSRR